MKQRRSTNDVDVLCLLNLKRNVATLYVIMCYVPQHNQPAVEPDQNLLTTETNRSTAVKIIITTK